MSAVGPQQSVEPGQTWELTLLPGGPNASTLVLVLSVEEGIARLLELEHGWLETESITYMLDAPLAHKGGFKWERIA